MAHLRRACVRVDEFSRTGTLGIGNVKIQSLASI